mgnify:CR=1 FL=1
MSINKLIMDALKPLGYPVYPMSYNGASTTYITFFEYGENSALDADDTEQYTGHYVQVDIWTKDGYLYTNLVEQSKKALIDAGFIRRSAIDLYESETQVYHKAMRFYFVQK